MNSYKKLKKCLYSGCKTMVLDTEGVLFCDQHNTKAKRDLIRNNPHGYNKYKANPTPIPKPLTKEEVFRRLSMEEKYKDIKDLGQEIYKLSVELLTKKRAFTKQQKIYFGWDKLEAE